MRSTGIEFLSPACAPQYPADKFIFITGKLQMFNGITYGDDRYATLFWMTQVLILPVETPAPGFFCSKITSHTGPGYSQYRRECSTGQHKRNFIMKKRPVDNSCLQIIIQCVQNFKAYLY